MLAKKQVRSRRPKKEVLTALSRALEEIEAYFEMWGFSLGKAENQPQLPFENPELQDEKSSEEKPEEQEAREDSDDLYGGDDDSGGEPVFDREEIEVAIDLFLSTLVQEKVIPKYPGNKLPTLEQVFQRIFGEDHEIIKVVHDFEEHIEGYFDVIGHDDMETAAN